MKEPGKETIIQYRESVDHYSEVPRVCGQEEQTGSDLHQQYKEDPIEKGIVSPVCFSESYYPNHYSEHNTEAQNKTDCIIHSVNVERMIDWIAAIGILYKLD